MTTQEQVKKAVSDFVRAGDTNDVALLDDVLNTQFQNVQDGFFEEKGIFVFSKEDYKKLVETKRFGGVARTIEFGPIDISGHMAHVKVRLESEFLVFNSSLLLVKEGEWWTVIHNIPKIEKK
ncbi:MAG TPA: nuclear transport factor 2 family protein [Cyclobacteriaceae bacterium]|nr:nuclear transport factor 2 family protein [Cyclobacteriaceae bacterium]